MKNEKKEKKVPPDPFNFGSIYGQGRTVDHALDSSFLQFPNSRQSQKNNSQISNFGQLWLRVNH